MTRPFVCSFHVVHHNASASLFAIGLKRLVRQPTSVFSCSFRKANQQWSSRQRALSARLQSRRESPATSDPQRTPIATVPAPSTPRGKDSKEPKARLASQKPFWWHPRSHLFTTTVPN